MRWWFAGVAGLAIVAGFWFLLRSEPQDAYEAAPVPPPAPRLAPELHGIPARPGVTPSAPPAEAVPAAPLGPNDVLLVGRVVDEGRRSVAGAWVKVVLPSWREVGGRTDSAGRYRLVLGPWDGIASASDGLVRPPVVWAGDGQGRVGSQLAVGLRREQPEVEVALLALGPAARLSVTVRDAAGPVPRARVHAYRLEASYGARLAPADADGAGRLDLGAVLPGTYRLVGTAADRGRGSLDVELRAGEVRDVVVELAPPRTLEVLVTSSPDGAAIAGARVSAFESDALAGVDYVGLMPPSPTGADGRTHLQGLGAGTLALRIEADGFEGSAIGMHAPSGGAFARVWIDGAPLARGVAPVSLLGTARSVRVELRRTVRSRWPIVGGDVPAPPEGAVLPVRDADVLLGGRTERHVRVEGGFLVADGWIDGLVRAHAVSEGAEPGEGTYANLVRMPSEPEGRPVTFRRLPRLFVRVHHPDGRPAVGFHVAALTATGNLVAGPVALDASGAATLHPLSEGGLLVHASRSALVLGSPTIGSADMRSGDARVEAIVPAPQEVLVHVEVDGRPGLPGGMTFTSLPYSIAAGLEVLEEDANAGTVRLRLELPPHPGHPLQLYVNAPGQLMTTVEVVERPTSGPWVARARLRATGSLRVRVRLGEGRRAESLDVQAWVPDRGAWVAARSQIGRFVKELRAQAPDGATETVVYVDDLVPDRKHRVIAPECLGVSEGVFVLAGQEVEVLLDLTASGWIEGVMDAPEGSSLQAVRVMLDGGDLVSDPYRGQSVDAQGAFRLRVPGTRPVRLLVRHPSLELDPAQEPLTVQRPGGRLVVRLVPKGSSR